MGKFNGLIAAEFNPPKNWVLLKHLTYQNELINAAALQAVGVAVEIDTVVVDSGFKTDLASVPRACWAFISPWDIARAAVVHDLLYSKIREYRANGGDDKKVIKSARKAADQVFLMGMKDAEPSIWKAKIYPAYWSVRAFGRWAIKPRD